MPSQSQPIWIDDDGRFEARVVAGPAWLRVTQHSPLDLGERGISSLQEMGEVLRMDVEAPSDGLELWIDQGQKSLRKLMGLRRHE